MHRVLLVAALVAAPALADDGIRKETVAVGETIEREVGGALGVRCDDLEIVAVEMRAKSADTNVLVITGKRAGKTTCRAGTDLTRATYLFEITVRPKGSVPRR